MGRKRGHEGPKKDESVKSNLEIPNPYIIRSVSKSESDESDVFENPNKMVNLSIPNSSINSCDLLDLTCRNGNKHYLHHLGNLLHLLSSFLCHLYGVKIIKRSKFRSKDSIEYYN